jgi:hypothetical protein
MVQVGAKGIEEVLDEKSNYSNHPSEENNSKLQTYVAVFAIFMFEI